MDVIIEPKGMPSMRATCPCGTTVCLYPADLQVSGGSTYHPDDRTTSISRVYYWSCPRCRRKDNRLTFAQLHAAGFEVQPSTRHGIPVAA